MKITIEGGKKITPKANDPVFCEDHNVTVKWGDLDAIQQLAVSEGLDIIGPRCILSPSLRRDK